MVTVNGVSDHHTIREDLGAALVDSDGCSFISIGHAVSALDIHIKMKGLGLGTFAT